MLASPFVAAGIKTHLRCLCGVRVLQSLGVMVVLTRVPKCFSVW
jgi:hypothetical protein